MWAPAAQHLQYIAHLSHEEEDTCNTLRQALTASTITLSYEEEDTCNTSRQASASNSTCFLTS
jgi:Zn-finger domain-containing protein